MYLWASSLACEALSSVYVPNRSIITFVALSLEDKRYKYTFFITAVVNSQMTISSIEILLGISYFKLVKDKMTLSCFIRWQLT